MGVAKPALTKAQDPQRVLERCLNPLRGLSCYIFPSMWSKRLIIETRKNYNSLTERETIHYILCVDDPDAVTDRQYCSEQNTSNRRVQAADQRSERSYSVWKVVLYWVVEIIENI